MIIMKEIMKKISANKMKRNKNRKEMKYEICKWNNNDIINEITKNEAIK